MQTLIPKYCVNCKYQKNATCPFMKDDIKWRESCLFYRGCRPVDEDGLFPMNGPEFYEIPILKLNKELIEIYGSRTSN